MNDETQSLTDAANMQQWIKSVEKTDDLAVQFNLKAPNPRFQLDYFSVRVGGNVVILPEHIWAGKDPFTFNFYNPEKGWPLGTGAYELISARENEFVYNRRDIWWGAQTGFEDMPAPRRLIWIVTGAEENRALLAADSQLDSVMDITLGAFEAIQAMNPNIIAWKDRMPYVWLDPCPRQMSVNHTVEPWDNAEMRRALSLIIYRQQIVNIAYEGTTIPSKTIFVEYAGMELYINAIKDLWVSPLADVAAGQTLIEANGWSGEAAEKYSEIVSQIGVLPLGDPKIKPLVVEAMKIFMAEQVTIPITQARKLVPFDTTYTTCS